MGIRKFGFRCQQSQLVAAAALSRPAYGHWVALENRAAVTHTIANMQMAFGLTPHLRGAVLRKFWSDLEGAEGDYSAGFTVIDDWLAACEAEGKKLLLCIVDKTYRNDHREPLPSYMSAYSIKNTEELHTPDGWGKTGQRWHSTYVTKLANLINAYQLRYRYRTGWEGIRYTDEQALGLSNIGVAPDNWSTIANGQPNPQPGAPWYNTPTDTPAGDNNRGSYQANTQNYSPCGTKDDDATRPTINGIQYTSTAYKNALISLIDQTEATRGNGWLYMSMNYLYGSTNSVGNNDIVSHVANSGSPLRVVCGNNNATYTSAQQINNSYNQYFPVARAAGVPLWVSVEQMDYSLAVTLTQIFDWFTKSAAGGGNPYDWGPGLHMIQWMYYDGGTYDFTNDAVAVIDSNPTFNLSP